MDVPETKNREVFTHTTQKARQLHNTIGVRKRVGGKRQGNQSSIPWC